MRPLSGFSARFNKELQIAAHLLRVVLRSEYVPVSHFMPFRFVRLALALLLAVCFQAVSYGRGPVHKALVKGEKARLLLKMPSAHPFLLANRGGSGAARSTLATEPVLDRALFLEDVEDDLPDTDDTQGVAAWKYGDIAPVAWGFSSPISYRERTGVRVRARRMFRAARSDLGSEG